MFECGKRLNAEPYRKGTKNLRIELKADYALRYAYKCRVDLTQSVVIGKEKFSGVRPARIRLAPGEGNLPQALYKLMTRPKANPNAPQTL